MLSADPQTLDAEFQEAVAAIDAGDLTALERQLTARPWLVRERLESPGEWLRAKVGKAVDADGFFAHPYLLWFVAEDPVRNDRLPANIAEAARRIIAAARREAATSLQEQLDYAIRLVAWSWVARQSGVQLALIDALADAGANLADAPVDALVNGNGDAAAHLVARGAPLTLGVALCLERWGDADRLARTATARDRQIALVLSALRGKARALARLLELGVDLDAYSTAIYSHATALHHAVYSGSLDAVRVLVEGGARLDIKDTAWEATPLGWAEYGAREGDRAEQYAAIAAYLRDQGAT